MWLLLFVPGPPDHPEKGIVLGFWMGKDSKDHPLGDRGSTGGPGFAESGARNWVHSAATVLAFLQRERGLLQPGYKFQPLIPDDATPNFDAKQPLQPPQKIIPVSTSVAIVDRSEPSANVGRYDKTASP